MGVDTTNGRNGRWITKENVIIVLLLGILSLSGSNKIDIATIKQKVTDHETWGSNQNDATIKRLDNLEQGKHPATMARFDETDALLMKIEIQNWTNINFVRKDE